MPSLIAGYINSERIPGRLGNHNYGPLSKPREIFAFELRRIYATSNISWIAHIVNISLLSMLHTFVVDKAMYTDSGPVSRR